MPLELIDTHCHLDYEPLASSREAVLARAQAAGVRAMLSIGTTVDTSRANIELAHRYPQIFAAVGVHPHEADSVTEADLNTIEELAADPRVVAVGEIGLDAYYKNSSVDGQRRAFEAFLGIARRRNLPVAIHCRDAYEPLLEILRRAASSWRGVMHCASGTPAFIEEALALGFHVSFSGTVTFPNAKSTRELVGLVPDDRLLIETDAPFLAPQPARGKPNEPAYLAHTAAHLAQLRGITVEALAALTSRNARRLFGLSHRPDIR